MVYNRKTHIVKVILLRLRKKRKPPPERIDSRIRR
nr:MAG TPA: hypothetical protein [Caudoviricetes sp.]